MGKKKEELTPQGHRINTALIIFEEAWDQEKKDKCMNEILQLAANGYVIISDACMNDKIYYYFALTLPAASVSLADMQKDKP